MHVSTDNRGVALLLIVIVLGVASLIIALNASLLGIGSLELGYTEGESGTSLSVADGCIEEGLRQLRLDNTYSGDTLSIGGGQCILSIASGGSTRTLLATATVQQVTAVIEVVAEIDANNTITITSWDRQ